MQEKFVKESAIDNQVYHVFPNDLNSKGTMFGGILVAEIDKLCAIVAERHSGTVCVTASFDAVNFKAPAKQGDILVFQAAINRAWNSSMEIGAKVIAERPGIGEKVHIVSAYATFVAINENRKPTIVPAVVPETEQEKLRFEQAEKRRQLRIAHKKIGQD